MPEHLERVEAQLSEVELVLAAREAQVASAYELPAKLFGTKPIHIRLDTNVSLLSRYSVIAPVRLDRIDRRWWLLQQPNPL